MTYDPATFEVLVPWPNRDAIRSTVQEEISSGVLEIPKDRLLDTRKFIDDTVAAKYSHFRAEYQKAQGEADYAFRLSLEADHGLSSFNQKTKDLIWDKAWKDGHSSGYGEVTNHYISIVELVENLLEAQK